jgi:ankyrin repeat protein
LERGARINDIVPMDETALIQACASGHLNVVRLLVNRGADVNLAAYSGGPNGEHR